MPQKGSINDKPNSPRTELVYLANTIDGNEHQITQDNYEELKPAIANGEMYGAVIVNEHTDQEVVVAMKHIVTIKKRSKRGTLTMRIRAVEEETVQPNTYQAEVECSNCGYAKVMAIPRGKLLVRMTCPECQCTTLSKKEVPAFTIHHKKDL